MTDDTTNHTLVAEDTPQKTYITVLAENSRSLHEVAKQAENLIDKLVEDKTLLDYAGFTDHYRRADSETRQKLLSKADGHFKQPLKQLKFLGATAMKSERDLRELSYGEVNNLLNASSIINNALNVITKLPAVEHRDKQSVVAMQRVLNEIKDAVDASIDVDINAKNADVLTRRANIDIPLGSNIDTATEELKSERKAHIDQLKHISRANAERIIPGFKGRMEAKIEKIQSYEERIQRERDPENAGDIIIR